MPGSILIIDDDRDVVEALRAVVEDDFSTIDVEYQPLRLPVLLANSYDVILLDMNFSAGINSGNEGLYWLAKIKEARPDAFVVLMTAYGNVDLAVEAIKRGASDFVLKPWDNEKLLATLRAGLRQRATPRKQTKPVVDFIAGTSAPMRLLQQQMEKIASTDASVLLLGENGTGKEVIARQIHHLSKREANGFFTVDISSIPSTLLESELFGHRKGAFTDARADRTGRMVEANGGTLFFDEIGNIPMAQQVKLLTALQTRAVVPIGANESVHFDVRLIAATNAPLQQMVERGTFRQDLFYRLNTITLRVPPLRERGDDIIALAQYFLRRYEEQYGKAQMTLMDDASSALLSYHWPGNVRELQHAIEKAVILSESTQIAARDIDLSISSKLPSGNSGVIRTLDQMEKEALVQALAAHSGNIVHASKALGITRQTLYNKMKKYGI